MPFKANVARRHHIPQPVVGEASFIDLDPPSPTQ
jgi:hypothetical protein